MKLSYIMNDRISHTKNLREELAKVTFGPYPANPWTNIESWIAKATPFIRTYWNNHFSDFQKVSAEPQWPKIAGVVGEGLYRTRWRANKKTAENALQKILSFIDGLLELETITIFDSEIYNLHNLRTLLTEGFTDKDLRRLCYDHSEFRPVYSQLAQDTGKADIIDKIIEYANQHLLIETLLNLAKEHNPDRYAKHKPYKSIVSA